MPNISLDEINSPIYGQSWFVWKSFSVWLSKCQNYNLSMLHFDIWNLLTLSHVNKYSAFILLWIRIQISTWVLDFCARLKFWIYIKLRLNNFFKIHPITSVIKRNLINITEWIRGKINIFLTNIFSFTSFSINPFGNIFCS